MVKEDLWISCLDQHRMSTEWMHKKYLFHVDQLFNRFMEVKQGQYFKFMATVYNLSGEITFFCWVSSIVKHFFPFWRISTRSIEKQFGSATVRKYWAPLSPRPGNNDKTCAVFERRATQIVKKTLSSATTHNGWTLPCNCKEYNSCKKDSKCVHSNSGVLAYMAIKC